MSLKKKQTRKCVINRDILLYTQINFQKLHVLQGKKINKEESEHEYNNK